MQITKQRLVAATVAGLLCGVVLAPYNLQGLGLGDLGKLGGKVAAAVKEAKDLYPDLKKDVKNLMEDKDLIEKDVEKLKQIPPQLEAQYKLIKGTLEGVYKTLEKTGKDVAQTGKDVGKVEKIWKALD